MKKVIEEILARHTKVCTCKETYKLNEDIEITVNQEDEKVVMWGFNYKSERSVNLSTQRFKKLMDGFKAVSSDLYSDSKYYYITLNPNCKMNVNSNVDVVSRGKEEAYELEIKQLKAEIRNLNSKIVVLEQEVSKYKEKVRHNARGAGRKIKFTEEQVSEIKSLRLEGKTIKELSVMYGCSVGLIHKLINES